jgi:flagellum-specific peptidoglycan hydrolase FlgJ
MLSEIQVKFLQDCVKSAKEANHIFPEMAACEAALESAWNTSKLAIEAFNLFGKKKPVDYPGETVSIPTREYFHGVWKTVPAEWVKYSTLQDCFADRMTTLKRLAPLYLHYDKALNSKTPEEYITEVSLTWSTDPQRAVKVQQIYNAHKDLLSETASPEGE